MSGERVTDERLEHWLNYDPTQVWFCKNCLDFHTPDWNCIKSFVGRWGKKTIDPEVQKVMKNKGITKWN